MSSSPVGVGPTDAVADPADHSAVSSVELGRVWVDRDLSWLEFNRRVLREALDERTPLLERVKFLAIFSSNLDEFFMKRMALIRPAPEDASHAAQERRELLLSVRMRIDAMLAEQAACYAGVLRPRLAEHGVHLVGWDDLTDAQRDEASAVFD